MDILSNLSDSLKELITLNGLNEKTLAEKSNVAISSISAYINKKQAPYLENLITLADFFGCSIDYLLERTDNLPKKEYKTCPPFSQRFNELLKLHKYSYADFQDKIAKSSFYEWKRGDSVPTLQNLTDLAKIFDCSVDYLLGRET